MLEALAKELEVFSSEIIENNIFFNYKKYAIIITECNKEYTYIYIEKS